MNSNLYYDPEFLTNYEIGFNSKIEELNLNLAAVIFHSDRKDQQVLISTQVDLNDPNTFTFLTQNAAEGTNNGIELEMDFQLSESLDMFINFGLLKTEIKSWKSRPEIEGRAQAHAPEKSYAIGFNWYPSEQSSFSFDLVGKSSFYSTITYIVSLQFRNWEIKSVRISFLSELINLGTSRIA